MYKHLTYTDRLRIEKWRNEGLKPREIADRLRVHISTIYRELHRGEYERRNGKTWLMEISYSPDIADKKYRDFWKAKGPARKAENDTVFIEYIQNKILNDSYSPAAALAEARHDGVHFENEVCLRTVYNYIAHGVFPKLTNEDLPEKGKRKRAYHKVKESSHVPAGESIEKRPDEINRRETFGHWEMDTVYSSKETSKQSLLVLTERLTRKEIIISMPNRKAESVVEAMDTMEKQFGRIFGRIFKTITVDNGMEFSDVEGLERSILGPGKRTKMYFCHPFCSSERGSNECQNKMIRRKHPKGTDFGEVSAQKIKETEFWMNNYPRKILDWKSSEMKYTECVLQILGKAEKPVCT
jgi:IS30 family transposase